MWKRTFFFCLHLIVFAYQFHTAESAGGDAVWGYIGNIAPKYWSKLPGYSECGATHQSPVNIDVSKTQYQASLTPFVFKATTKGTTYEIRNYGPTVDITFGGAMWNGSFVDHTGEHCYRVLQMHFHWGKTDAEGSEHTINKQQYPLELHIVMWNCRDFKNFTDAIDGVNGLAVIGVLFTVDDTGTPNPVLESICKELNKNSMKQCPCTKVGGVTQTASQNMSFFDINQLLPTTVTTKPRFYRYKGSLTTPPCTENVLWSVFDTKMKVTSKQMAIFRSLKFAKDSKGVTYSMVNNYRHTYPLNPNDPANALRVISRSWQAGSNLHPGAFVIGSVTLVASICLMFRQ